MLRKIQILLALAVVTTASVSGCARVRRWCHRGSPCLGTSIAAPTAIAGPAIMAAPAAVATPAPRPQVVPAPAQVVAPAPVQQVIVPQPIYCCPQPVPCCPQPVPCCPPIVCDPCPHACPPGCFDGYVEGDCGPVTSFDEGYLVPGTETPLDSDDSDADPGPAREN